MRDLETRKWLDKHPQEFLMSIIHYVREDAYRVHVLTEEMQKASMTKEGNIESLGMTVSETLRHIDESTENIMQMMVLASEYANSYGWEPQKD